MGSRGASAGINFNKDEPYDREYGSEYSTVAQLGNIKIVKVNEGSPTAPMETRTIGRVYATLDKNNNIGTITFYDSEGLRSKQIDITGSAHNGIKTPHTHLGYEHSEDGFREINKKEEAIINRILKYWERHKKDFFD